MSLILSLPNKVTWNSSLRSVALFCCAILLGSIISQTALAEDESPTAPTYIELYPQFIVNHIGDGSGSKLKYIRTKISVRTTFGKVAMVEANLPIIRDAIVMYLSSRTTEQVTGALAREETRKGTTEAVNAALLEEMIDMEEPLIQDILFTSFLTQ